MRHTFESLGYQSGFYLSQLFSSTRNTSSSSSSKPSSAAAIRPPPSLFNWPHRPPLLPSATSILSSPANLHHSSTLGLIPQPKDQTHLFLHNYPSEDMMAAAAAAAAGDHENDIKWPNGLSFFNALTDQTEDATDKHFFNPDPSEFLSLDSHPERKMDRYKRSFTLPPRVASSSLSSSASMDQQQQQPVDYRNSEGGLYPDVMGTFLE